MKWARQKGFTIVELLIVIIVIAILAAVTIIAFNGVQSRAAQAAAQSSVTNAIRKVELFNVDNGIYPTSITGCPAPGATELCLSPGSGATFLYHTSAAPDQPDVGIATMGANQFFYETKGEAIGGNEFLRYADIAPFIDRYGLVKYELEFDIRSTDSSTDNTTQIYMQNGSTTKYSGPYASLTVTNTYQHHEMTFTAGLNNASVSEAWLAFYGTYATGNRPVVRNVKLSLAP